MKCKSIVIIMILAISLPAAAYAKSLRSDDAYDNLHREISARNLVKGLFLSDEQKTELLKIAKKAQAVSYEMKQKTHTHKNRAIVAMDKINAALKAGKEPPREAVKAAQQAKEDMLGVRRNGTQKLHTLEAEATSVLTPNQLAVVKKFKPCLVPPKNSQNPSPAGAAKDGTGFERMLTKLYNCPKEQYDMVSEGIFDKHVRYTERVLGPMSEDEIQAEKQRLDAIVAKARSMNKTDFELNKADLADQMAEPILDFQTGRAKAFDQTRTRWHLGRVGSWMLDPVMVKVLQSQ